MRLSIAIFAQTFLWLRSSREHFLSCNLRAKSSVFAQTFLQLWTSIAIFVRSCYLFCAQFSIAIFARSFLWTCLVRTMSLLDFLSWSDDVFWSFFRTMRVSSFGRCGNGRGSFGRRIFCSLFWLSILVCLHTFGLFTMSLLDYTFSFGLFTHFQNVYTVSFGFSFCSDAVAYLGCGYFRRRLFRMLLPRFFWTPSLLAIVSFGRGRSSSDATALLCTRMLSLNAAVSLDADSYGGVLTNFTCVPWYTYLDI